MALPDDVTIEDIINTLRNPESYVRKALANLHDVGREHEEVVLRLGRTGTGQVPHYRIDRRPLRDISGEEWGDLAPYTPLKAFDGRSHKPLVADGDESILRDEHWSHRCMTFGEVQNLLGRLRGKH